jgi:hypothetical protein
MNHFTTSWSLPFSFVKLQTLKQILPPGPHLIPIIEEFLSVTVPFEGTGVVGVAQS